jgi:APA family basic amino acid/polyamine antiporter
MSELKRTLGLSECIFFGVGSILGAGIYTLIGKVAGLSGNFIWLSFAISSVCAIFTALSYAELSAAFPKAGGEYVYAKRAFGKKIGQVLGVIISLNGIIVGATVALGFAGYLSNLLDINRLTGSIAIIIIIFLINISGIRQSSNINIIFTLIEATGLLLVIFYGFSRLGDINYFEMPAGGFNGVFSAAALAFFGYVGFEEIVKLAEETKEPEKNIPKALIASGVIVTVMYLLVALCSVSVIPYQDLSDSNSPLADVLGVPLGKNGVLAITVIALFATSNTILSNMIGSSRVLLDMAKETKIIKKLSYISPKRQTPVAALTLIFVMMLAFALIGNIETIARIATMFIFVVFLVVNLAVIVLRVKEKDLPRPFKIAMNVKNVPITSVLGIVFTLVLLGYTITEIVT